jgi:hypothetical protein
MGATSPHGSSDCLQVLAEARRLNFFSVRGNHDDEALAAYEAYKRGRRVPKKREYVKDMPAGAAEWLHALPFTISLPSYGIVIVHAGIVPDVGLCTFGCPILHTADPLERLTREHRQCGILHMLSSRAENA